MKYLNVKEGVFLKRPNRFIAHVLIDGREEVVHVKNTGRCKELLQENCGVYLEKSQNPLRKTAYDLIAADKNGLLINMDSIAPNFVAAEIFKDYTVHREVRYKSSRFDLFIEETRTFVEVKGVTLEENGVARFPDAPTERGRKHLMELIDAKNNGFNACILFILQFEGAKLFMPNVETDGKFAEALALAKKNGVEVLAYDCKVTPDSIVADRPVKVLIQEG